MRKHPECLVKRSRKFQPVEDAWALISALHCIHLSGFATETYPGVAQE